MGRVSDAVRHASKCDDGERYRSAGLDVVAVLDVGEIALIGEVLDRELHQLGA